MKNNKMLNIEIVPVDKFIKINDIKEVTNIVTFNSLSEPTPDGLLSREIFGTTPFERTQYFGYIDLVDTFIDPSSYDIWCQIDKNIKPCIHGTNKYIVEDGKLVQSDSGKNGINFLKSIFDDLKYSSNGSRKRETKIEFIKNNKNAGVLFINKYLVFPAFYRDSNTTDGTMGLSSINKLYHNLLMTAKSLRDIKASGYGDLGFIHGRMQETIFSIYKWCIGKEVVGIEKGAGLYGKYGYFQTAAMAKTVDKSCRLVITAPDLSGYQTIDEMKINLFTTGSPLSATLANAHPFVIFHIKRMIDNNFFVIDRIEDDNGKEHAIPYDTILETFSDDRLDKEIEYFIHSHYNRLKPVEIKVGKDYYHIYMKPSEEGDHGSIYNRPLLWLDVFYIATILSTSDKNVYNVRYPIDSHFNGFPTKIHVVTTKNTEKCVINGIEFDSYPVITPDMVGKNTSNLFTDALQISNLHMAYIMGDYDGDMVNHEMPYIRESNEEIDKHINSKAYFIAMSGTNIKNITSKDAIQTLYCLTYVCDEDKNTIGVPEF